MRCLVIYVVGSAFVAAMHGAQDGQKSITIAMLALHFPRSELLVQMYSRSGGTKRLLCSFEYRNYGRDIKNGMEIKLERYQGFAASFPLASASLLLSTLTGLPVSNNSYK